MSNTVQQREFLYTWFKDHDDDFQPGKWMEHLITKKTPKLVFVQYKIGRHIENLRLRRAELEDKGEIYWIDGTLVRHFYTQEKKDRVEAYQKTKHIPECFKVLGLNGDATADDVKRAYHEAALKSHPDTGGSHEAFLKLQEHYNAALRMARP